MLKVSVKINEKEELEAVYDGDNMGEAVFKVDQLLGFDGRCKRCGNATLGIRNCKVTQDKRNHICLFCKSCGNLRWIRIDGDLALKINKKA